MTKQEVIKKAYGKYYPQLERCLDENGWSNNWNHLVSVESRIFQPDEIEKSGKGWRPKSLKGIENNNGWIKIESENDLPKDKSIDVIVDSKPYQGFIYEAYCGLCCCIENRYNQNELSGIIEASLITHYQSIIKPDLPIY